MFQSDTRRIGTAVAGGALSLAVPRDVRAAVSELHVARHSVMAGRGCFASASVRRDDESQQIAVWGLLY